MRRILICFFQASITYACGAQRELENKKRLVENTFETLRQLSLDREGSSKSQVGIFSYVIRLLFLVSSFEKNIEERIDSSKYDYKVKV